MLNNEQKSPCFAMKSTLVMQHSLEVPITRLSRMPSFVNSLPTSIARDFRNSIRLWQSNPGTTLASYIALTLGIGATISVFSVLNCLLIRPLPIADSGHVLHVGMVDLANKTGRLSLPDLLDIKKREQLADTLAFYRDVNGNLSAADRGNSAQPTVVHILEADATLFAVMGVRLQQGHPFSTSANQPGHPCEAVLSWSLWKANFNSEPVTGRSIRLNEHPCQVDGVLPESFDLPVDADIWTPFAVNLANPNYGRGIRTFGATAHLRSGSTIAAYNAELANIVSQLSRENPTFDAGLHLEAATLQSHLSESAAPTVLILFAAVSGVLLMACVNVANLLLARSSTRMREISVRMAVGASRLSVLQQMLIECMLLALVSSISGLALSAIVIRWLKSLPILNLPRLDAVAIDWRVALFALLAAGVTGLFFGALPAIKVSRASIMAVLGQNNGRVSESRRQQLARKILIVFETALASVLLIGSLLLLHSLNVISDVPIGFQKDHLLTAYVSLNRARFRYTEDSSRLARNVLAKLKGKPGITSAAFTTNIPLQGGTSGSGPIQIEGQPLSKNPLASQMVVNTGVSPNFRATLNIPLKAGVDLNENDDREDATSVLVNDTFSKTFFPDGNVVGKRFRFSPYTIANSPYQQIVGVIGDTHQDGPEAAVRPEIYRPLTRATNTYPGIVIRTADNPLSHLRDLAEALHQVDSELPIFYPRTMDQVEARRLGPRHFVTTLLTGFAALALLLASGGIFAVIAYSVSQRTSEIGVRMACGASHSDVLRMIVWQGLLPALIGIVIGLAGALFLSRLLESLLFGVKATDAFAYAGTVLLLAASSALAAWLPARRATRIQPWQALRYE